MLSQPPYNKILVANRGEIALRVIQTCREMGIATIAVYSEADAQARHVQEADEAFLIGPSPASESYLQAAKIIAVAIANQAQAIHPGYGFLSENHVFAQACQDAGVDFIGPSAAAMALMGNKMAAKACMEKAGVPIVPGYYGTDQSWETLQQAAFQIGFPLLVKAAAGGGGKGMRVVAAQEQLAEALESARREALNAFGDSTIFLERYFTAVRHIEFQVLADAHGQVRHLYERECSLQRRHQKVLEETPSPILTPALRDAMAQAAIQAVQASQYTNAGTVEMLLDDHDQFYFLEMNTRLQVEHPVTELLLGVDLVNAQLQVAKGWPMPWSQDELKPRGHAIEVRICAEDPAHQFFPTTGQVKVLHVPQMPWVRFDSALYPGLDVTPYYDSMLGKLIVWGQTRSEALQRLGVALDHLVILGLTTNIPFLRELVRHPAVQQGNYDTRFVEQHSWCQPVTEVPWPVLLAATLSQQPTAAPSASAAGQDPYNPWLRLGQWSG